MEPRRQVEIQLGHMCNNRCVFCVSGQQTALGRAKPSPVEPILARVSEAHASGHRKITLLGGEPTLQPGFLEVVRHAVALGFEEIVVFTNGAKTARAKVIDEILATGGNFTWRISIQGATRESHDFTTKKPGAFDRILRTLDTLHARGQRITVNMCVVQSNMASVIHFPELLAPYGVTQLHLDMVRPADAGERTEEEFRAMIPRYSDLAHPLARMIEGFAPEFDVNVGNLPYCIAPGLARWIHHDGEHTETIAIDGDGDLSRPWNKYFVKRQDKGKPETCRQCVFDERCNGIFDKYRTLFGTAELVPVTPERLRAVDPGRRLLWAHLAPIVRRLRQLPPPAPFDTVGGGVESDISASVVLRSERDVVAFELRPTGSGDFGFDGFDVRVAPGNAAPDLIRRAADWLAARVSAEGWVATHPVGDDRFVSCAPSLASRVARLRSAAPFGALRWTSVRVEADGTRAVLGFDGPKGEQASLWLGEAGGRPTGGYTVEGRPSEAIVEGLRAVMSELDGTKRPGLRTPRQLPAAPI